MRRLILPALIFLLTACATSPYSKITNFHAGRGTNLICFGDSLTAGVGAQPGTAYPDLLSGNVRFPVINAGVSGDTTTSALARLQRDVLDKSPRVVIIELGANDYLRAPAGTTAADNAYENLREMIVRIQGDGAIVAIADVFISAEFTERCQRLARKYGCLYIPDVMAGVMNDPSMMADPLHPNSFGYAKMAANIMNVLQPMLKALP